MNKIYKIVLTALAIGSMPVLALAATPVQWVATSSTSFINPVNLNGVAPNINVNGTGTSTFMGNLQVMGALDARVRTTFGGQMFAPNGSTGAPAYSFLNAPSSGLWSSSGSIFYQENGNVRFTTGGNADTRFAHGLEIASAANQGSDIFLTRASAGLLGITGTGSTGSAISVGISTTTPWGQLSVNPNGITGPSFVIGSSTKTYVIVDNGGRVFFPQLTAVTGGTNRPACYVAATGELVDDTTSVCQVSSREYKKNIKTLDVSGLSLINALTPVSYEMKEDVLYDYKDTQYGFIAEEVAQVDPHLAEYVNGKPRTLDDRAIMASMVKAIQELNARIKVLEANQK